MTRRFAYRFRPAAVLKVSGEDAFGFLQGQFSNDIRPVSAGTVTYGLWLNPKGKVEGDAFLIQRSDGSILLVSPGCQADVLRARLDSFVIADDVTLDDVTARWTGIAVWGTGAERSATLLGAGLPVGRHAHDEDGLVGIVSHRWGADTIEWLFEEREVRVVASAVEWGSAGFSMLADAGAERERILHGGVAVPLELGPGDLPQEAGVEDFAISFTKGCFVGQEVMARLKSMGRVRRGLIRVRGEGAPPALPATLFAGERRIGELRSMAPLESGGFIGRAMVTLTDLPSQFTIGGPEDGAPAVTRDEA